MKYITPLLVLGMMYCSPFTPAPGNVELLNSEYVVFQMEEWYGYMEYYVCTYGEVSVTGTVQNTGQGVANRVMLTVGLYADQDCTQLVYEGQSPICDRIEAGVIHQFELKHKYEFTHEGGSKGVKLSVSNN